MTKLMPENQHKVVVVLGVHRSGTSAVTRVLNLLGVDLGRLLMPPAPSNVTGFWEHSEIVGINDKILEALGSDPFDPRNLSYDWKQPNEQIDRFKQLIFEAIKREFSSSSLWGIKDPRMCRLLPLWKPIFKQFNCQPLFIIAIRNPKEVAESLKKRDGLSIPLSYFLWMRYMMQAELDTRGEKRVFINYENLLADWKTVMSHISTNLQLAWPKKCLDVESEVNDFLKSELRHHIASEDDIETGDILSDFVHKIYSVLLQMTHEGMTYPAVLRLSFLEKEFSKMDRLGCVNGYLSFIERISLERNELRRHAGNLQLERDHLQKHAKTLGSENQALKGHAENLQLERDHLQKHAKTLGSENQALKGHAENLQTERDHLEKHAKTLENENDNLDLLLSQRNSRLKEIRGSLTWLLAGPIYSIERLLRETRKTVATKLTSVMKKRGLLFNEVFPAGDFVGNLESPSAKVIDETNTIVVSGWLFDKKPTQLKTLILQINKTAEYTLTFGLERPDVAQAFYDYPSAGMSGFKQSIPLDTKRHSLELHIFSICENGQRVCCFARKINIKKSKAKKINYRLFLTEGSQKVCSSLREGKISISPKVWIKALRGLYWAAAMAHHSGQNHSPYQRWIQLNRLTPKLLECLTHDAAKLITNAPKISVVVPVYNPPKQFLTEMIQSIKDQIYQNWELCLVDDASTKGYVRKILRHLANEDSRIKVHFSHENSHIVVATNQGLKMATGEYIAFLDHDDILSKDALLHVAECIHDHPQVDWIYTDEDKIDQKGNRYDPQFKGQWNPEMAITHNFTHHLAVIRRYLIEKVGMMRKGYEGAQDLDLFLRVAENSSPYKIIHIPYVCYHWRCYEGSTACHGTQKEYVFKSAKKAISDAIKRRGLKAEPFLPEIGIRFGLSLHQLKWHGDLLANNPVTIVIPTKDKVDLLRSCISSLVNTVNKQYVKLLIIDDNSKEKETQKYYQELARNQILPCHIIKSADQNGRFNFAGLMNQAVQHIDTPYVLFLNNDVEAIESGWLEDMVGWASIKGVGAVGAKLLYPDERIQHGGVVVGPHFGLADHQFNLLQKDKVGYLALPHAARNVSAVSAACLLTTVSLFREMGGFDETNFSVQYNDVDYCLRLWKKGFRVVYSPQAVLTHHEKSSRGHYYDSQEHLNFIHQHKDYRDLFFNSNLSMDSMQMAVNSFHFAYSDRVKRLNVLLISHNLNLEGAPLVLLEIAKHFKLQGGWEVYVLSLADGPLKEKYDEAGIPVKIVKAPSKFNLKDSKTVQKKLIDFGTQIGISNYNIVIANTLDTFWGVELARLFDLPSIWMIHESHGPEREAAILSEGNRSIFYSCFKHATRVLFVAHATQAIYQHLNENENFRVIPNGINCDLIKTFLEQHNKSELRTKYSLPLDHDIVTVVGTICERKGQIIFLRAAAELQKRSPDLKISFVLVGARRDAGSTGKYLESLYEELRCSSLRNVYIFDETKNAYDFFALSDIFVCSSYEESFPMVLLEAMAFGLGIVSTDVCGIPEMISHEHEGILIPLGDPLIMASAIRRLIDNPGTTNLLGKNARIKAMRVFDYERWLKKHFDLVREAYLCHDDQCRVKK